MSTFGLVFDLLFYLFYLFLLQIKITFNTKNMKQPSFYFYKPLFILTLLICSNYSLSAQKRLTIGGVAGANFSALIEDKNEGYVNDDELSGRYGFVVKYTTAGLFYLRSGLEFSSRIIKVNSPETTYELDYLHIPVLLEMNLFQDDGANGWFYAVNYGFMFDVLLNEKANDQEVDTGFRNLNMNFHLSSSLGYVFFDDIRVSVSPFYNYTLNRVVVNDVLGKKRASYFGATANVTIDLYLE